jgi:hypothetical protein
MCAPRVPAGREKDAEFLLDVAMNTGMGMKEVIKRGGGKVQMQMPLPCCGASKNVVANRSFQAHSEFNPNN